MSEKYVYITVIACFDRNHDSQVSAFTDIASNRDEARGRAMRLMESLWPKSGGYTRHAAGPPLKVCLPGHYIGEQE